jgi:hypothetical protein
MRPGLHRINNLLTQKERNPMSIRCNRSLSTVAIVAGIFSGMFAASPLQAQEWEWTAVPYVWASDMSLDVKVDGDEVLGSDLDFSDLLDKLDLALQLHFEGRRGRGGFFVDVTYLETSDRSTTPPRAILPGGAQLDTDAETLLVEGAGHVVLAIGVQSHDDVSHGFRVRRSRRRNDPHGAGGGLPPPRAGCVERHGRRHPQLAQWTADE